MSELQLRKTASPHLRKGRGVRKTMGLVLLALLPAVLGSVFLFGPSVLPVYLVSIGACCAADVLARAVKKQPLQGFDYSPVVTGTLLAMSLPVTVPLWMPVLGGCLAIWVAKELFGGIGSNFLNPALLGRLVLRLAFPDTMLQNPVPAPPFGAGAEMDALAGATPLQAVKEHTSLSPAALWDSFLGLTPGKLGETSALLLLLGGLFLLVCGIIRWRIPLAFFGSIAVLALLFGGPSGLFSGGWQTVAAHLLGGATMLGGWFMITDYGSSPSAPAAQWVYGALCGVVTMLFRFFSPWSEGFTFSILICNLTVPLLLRFVRPRVLGEKKKAG